jgi:predicted GNAT family N-acyltransferase
MNVVKLDGVREGEWDELTGREPEAWGGVGETLEWARKQHHFGVRDHDGRLVALAGVVTMPVSVAGHEFAVAGIGSVIVTPRMRGTGLGRAVFERALACAQQLGPEFAMLFCMPDKVALYEKFAFALIADPVTAEQPQGRIEVPMRAMWRVLEHVGAGGAQFPAGTVDVLGLPF